MAGEESSVSSLRPPRVLSLAACLLFLSRPLTAEEVQPLDVWLTNTSGPVTLTLDDAKGSPLLSGDMPLEEGDVIATGPRAAADVAFNERTLVRLLGNSELELRRLTPKKTLLILRTGVLLAKVNYDKGDGQLFHVLTHSAVVSVLGTEFVVEQRGPQTRVGLLNEGHVLVKSPAYKKRVVMRFNQETVVRKGYPPADAGVLQRLYPHKVQMADMRDRIKRLRRHVTEMTPQQKVLLRAGWVKTHGSRPRRKPSRSSRRSPAGKPDRKSHR